MYSIILYSCMVVYYQYFNKIIINAYIVHVIYCRCSYTTSITKSFFFGKQVTVLYDLAIKATKRNSYCMRKMSVNYTREYIIITLSKKDCRV